MSAVIPPEFQPFVVDGIASGRFRSEEEAVTEALGLLRSREQKLNALRKDIQTGLDDLDAGRTTPFDVEDIFRRGRQRRDGSRVCES
jgi:antitoxin ParD1/3/4